MQKKSWGPQVTDFLLKCVDASPSADLPKARRLHKGRRYRVPEHDVSGGMTGTYFKVKGRVYHERFFEVLR